MVARRNWGVLDVCLIRGGNSYNDDASNHEDWDCLEGDMVEKWLKQHGRLYPLFSGVRLLFHPPQKEM